MRQHLSRLAQLLVIAAGVAIAVAPPALADAAGPTDYNTEIVSIEPATSAIHVEMIGGDSFISLQLLEQVDVTVIGYEGEPYLLFKSDGEVLENRRSPTTWLNQDRYGSRRPPSYASADAIPEWLPVDYSGQYAWHDHRSHWMNDAHPPGAKPGDQVLEAAVPLLVDGSAVNVTVASYLLDSPPVWPSVVGVLLAAGVAVVALRSDRLGRTVPVIVLAGAALVLGLVGFGSVPSETEPDRLLWALPLVALVASSAVVVARNRLATTVYLDGLATAAGAGLLFWGLTRFDALRRSLIPSDAPAWLDRLVIAAALLTGAVIAAQGVVGLLRPKRLLVT